MVRQHFGQLRSCYETGLGRNATLSGQITVRFVISEEGTVQSALSVDSALSDEQVRDCILLHFQQMQFPKHKQGKVTVVYPLQLGPR